jgi:hypothetical protein
MGAPGFFILGLEPVYEGCHFPDEKNGLEQRRLLG